MADCTAARSHSLTVFCTEQSNTDKRRLDWERCLVTCIASLGISVRLTLSRPHEILRLRVKKKEDKVHLISHLKTCIILLCKIFRNMPYLDFVHAQSGCLTYTISIDINKVGGRSHSTQFCSLLYTCMSFHIIQTLIQNTYINLSFKQV